MFWSRNSFFKQSKATLKTLRHQVSTILVFKSIEQVRFLTAFDFFVFNPSEFDGATIVKDLDDLPNLDLSAMVHDYYYIKILPHYKGLKWLKEKIKMDWQYGKDMELLGKGITIPYSRAIGLILTTPIYWLILKFR